MAAAPAGIPVAERGGDLHVRSIKRARALAVLGGLVAVAAALSGCSGTGEARSSAVPGRSLTIYSSLPLQGEQARRGADVHRAAQLAMNEVGGRVGKFRIKYVVLDGSTLEARRWDPSQVSANARRAVQDAKTVAYLGELDPGASAISIPILNQGGILQVSPTDGLAGLTSDDGATRGEPDKYYPNPDRNFGRVIQPDRVQADALLSYMRQVGVRRVFVLNDGGAYGTSLAERVRRTAGARGVRLSAYESTTPQADPVALAEKVRASGADAVLYAGVAQPAVGRLGRALAAADRRLKLFGPHDLARPEFLAGLGRAGDRTYLTDPVLEAQRRSSAARKFTDDFQRAYGRPPDRHAVYGYEAMSAVLQAIREAGARGNDRKRLIDGFFKLRRPESVLGPYSIDRRGDPTLDAYGAYRLRDGGRVFDRVVRPGAH